MGLMRFLNRYRIWKAKIHTALLRREFGAMGSGCVIYPPLHCYDPSGIFLGDGCIIRPGTWLDTVHQYCGQSYDGRLEMGDRTSIGHNCHIIAAHRISIGKDVLMANGVYISDNLHGFEDIARPVPSQPLKVPGPVVIEDEVWLGWDRFFRWNMRSSYVRDAWVNNPIQGYTESFTRYINEAVLNQELELEQK